MWKLKWYTSKYIHKQVHESAWQYSRGKVRQHSLCALIAGSILARYETSLGKTKDAEFFFR